MSPTWRPACYPLLHLHSLSCYRHAHYIGINLNSPWPSPDNPESGSDPTDDKGGAIWTRQLQAAVKRTPHDKARQGDHDAEKENAADSAAIAATPFTAGCSGEGITPAPLLNLQTGSTSGTTGTDEGALIAVAIHKVLETTILTRLQVVHLLCDLPVLAICCAYAAPVCIWHKSGYL